MTTTHPSDHEATPRAATGQDTTSGGSPLRAGKAPVGTGASPLVAQLVALGLVALGVVAVQHLLVQLGAVQGTSWAVSALESADGLEGSSVLVLVVGVVAVVLGLLLLPVALRPRPRKGLAVRATTGVHLRPRDLARVLEARLEGIDGVTDVRVKATRRRVRVRATSVAGKDRGAATKVTVRDRVEPVLGALEHAPRLSVSVRHDEI